jgi:hypothetical protein
MLKLSGEQRGRLCGLRRSPGWEDLLDIGEKLCQLEETELLKMDRAAGATLEQIGSKQDQCRGFRLLFEKLQIEMNVQEAALLEEQKNAEGAPLAGSARGEPDVLGAADILGILPGTGPEADEL